ncbi:MAG: YaiI/YqxD family protein [Gemmataceae bacterium]
MIYVDADACPVKDEIYRVARRFAEPVVVVANSSIRVPQEPGFELVVKTAFGEVDDWIAAQCQVNDLVVTADIPLAARALERGAYCLDPRGNPFTERDIGYALAMRERANELRLLGEATSGPPPFSAKDRSRFLSKLDEILHVLRKRRA